MSLNLKISKDIGYKYQFGFQDPGSNVMESIINLHHDIMFLLIFIVVKIIVLICIISNLKEEYNSFFSKSKFYKKVKDIKFVL
jgi:hypothetical protein